jgi:hypothetical protein
MDLKSVLSEIDGLLQKGKFVEAAKKFFAEDIETINENNHSINGKEAKIASLNDLQSHIKKVHSVKLLNQSVSENTTFSELNYHYEYHNGAQQSYGEVIKRVWDKNGKIVSEKYYKGPLELEKKAEKKEVAKKAEPTAAKKELTKATAPKKEVVQKPAAAKAPASKATTKKK